MHDRGPWLGVELTVDDLSDHVLGEGDEIVVGGGGLLHGDHDDEIAGAGEASKRGVLENR